MGVDCPEVRVWDSLGKGFLSALMTFTSVLLVIKWFPVTSTSPTESFLQPSMKVTVQAWPCRILCNFRCHGLLFLTDRKTPAAGLSNFLVSSPLSPGIFIHAPPLFLEFLSPLFRQPPGLLMAAPNTVSPDSSIFSLSRHAAVFHPNQKLEEERGSFHIMGYSPSLSLHTKVGTYSKSLSQKPWRSTAYYWLVLSELLSSGPPA